MMITPYILNQISDSAALEWQPEEKEGIIRDLQQIVNYMDKLKEVDTEGIPPLSHLCFHESRSNHDNRFREDEAAVVEAKEAMLANAAKTREGYFIVPKSV